MAGRRRKSKGGHSIRVGTVLALSTEPAGDGRMVPLDMRRPRWLSPGFMDPGFPAANAVGRAWQAAAEDLIVYPR